MQKYIITGKTSQETAASMLNKPQNRREITEPLAEAFGAKFIEFLYQFWMEKIKPRKLKNPR